MTKAKTSFVYIWTNKKTKMKYVGCHKGSSDDGYLCSSKEMLKVLCKNPEHFKRKIIAYGSITSMKKLEKTMLKNILEQNEKHKWYNKNFPALDSWILEQIRFEEKKLRYMKKYFPNCAGVGPEDFI